MKPIVLTHVQDCYYSYVMIIQTWSIFVTFRIPYAIVYASNLFSSNGRDSALPSTQLIPSKNIQNIDLQHQLEKVTHDVRNWDRTGSDVLGGSTLPSNFQHGRINITNSNVRFQDVTCLFFRWFFRFRFINSVHAFCNSIRYVEVVLELRVQLRG